MPEAETALQAVLDRIQNGDTGLNRASQAVQGTDSNPPVGPSQSEPTLPSQSHASLPSQALTHPTATDHPGKP